MNFYPGYFFGHVPDRMGRHIFCQRLFMARLTFSSVLYVYTYRLCSSPYRVGWNRGDRTSKSFVREGSGKFATLRIFCHLETNLQEGHYDKNEALSSGAVLQEVEVSLRVYPGGPSKNRLWQSHICTQMQVEKAFPQTSSSLLH